MMFKRLLVGLLLVSNTAVAQTRSDRDMLVMVLDSGDHMLGIMFSESTCLDVAKWLNTWASFPPASPVRFVCREVPEVKS